MNKGIDKDPEMNKGQIELLERLHPTQQLEVNSNWSAEKAYQTEASPSIWVPLSLLVAVIYAFGNITNSVIAKYQIKARYLQSPGSIVGNGFPLVFTSIYDKYYGYKNNDWGEDIRSEDISYFKWFYDIFFYKVNICTESIYCDTGARPVTPRYKIYWSRVLVAFILGILGVLQQWTFFLSYDYASRAHLNNGVLMSVFSIKPILNSITFYLFFKQKLKLYEVFGIVLCVICAGLIALSTSKGDSESSMYYSLLALTVLLVSLVTMCLMTASIKHFFGSTDNGVNISAFFNFLCLIIDVIFFVLFIIDLHNGFEFTRLELWCGIIGGYAFSLSGYLVAYVNIRGKAGTSDALIETCVVYQTILDAFFFDRYPNLMQICGLIIGFIATLLIIVCHRIDLDK